MDSTEAYLIIERDIIPAALERFRSRQRDYSGGPAFLMLGAKGQFSDINRKFWKLYRAIWEGQQLDGEQPMEIVEDFVGHCFLLLFCLWAEDPDNIWPIECTCTAGDKLLGIFALGCPRHDQAEELFAGSDRRRQAPRIPTTRRGY